MNTLLHDMIPVITMNFSQWMTYGLLELGWFFLVWMLTWGISYLLRHHITPKADSVWFGMRLWDGLLFPLLLLSFMSLLYFGGHFMGMKWHLIPMVIPACVALLMIRTVVKILDQSLQQQPWVKSLERTFSWVIWGVTVLWLTGLLPRALAELDEISWKVGATHLSIRTLLEALVSALVVLILSLWFSAMIERRLLGHAQGVNLSWRKAASSLLRTVLLVVGLMMTLSAVGIDLTALSVIGGALGVGIGLGLQKLTANYVSGFVILAEGSMRIGDSVQVDGFEGIITDIKMRYTVIRAPTGRESIVPNEMLLTQRIENLSLADPKVWLSTIVTVGYESDVALVQQLLVEAALSQSRVLTDPPPHACLTQFAADGLEWTLGYWINDPEKGQLKLRSDINLAVLERLSAHRIAIPYPQRVVHHLQPS